MKILTILWLFSRWNNAEDAPRAPLPSTTMDDMANNVGINQKAAREKQRIEIEKRRKKAQKKKERLAAMDAAGERQKKTWQNFSSKITKKKKLGVVSKICSCDQILELWKPGLLFVSFRRRNQFSKLRRETTVWSASERAD